MIAPEQDLARPSPLVDGFAIRPDAGVRTLTWADIVGGPAACPGERRWLHLDISQPEAAAWLAGPGALAPIVVDALLDADTRPRTVRLDEGRLISLRGVNLNPGADPEDMLTLTLWVTGDLVITTRAERIRAIDDVRDAFRAGRAPPTQSAFVCLVLERLIARIAPVVDDLDDQVEALEIDMLEKGDLPERGDVSGVRRAALGLRRFMAPQREAVMELLRDGEDFLTYPERMRLRESLDDLSHMTDELDAVRERAQLLNEAISERRQEATAHRLFLLSIVSAVFLPLSFVTGLFGVNVGGIPGGGDPLGFTLLAGGLGGLALALMVLFRALKWF